LKVYYFNTAPHEFGIKKDLNEKTLGHHLKKTPKAIFITPTSFSKKNVSPKNLHQLKMSLKIKNIYMFDRIIGLNKNILISDHINRSGVSFLRGKTPYKNRPMFPDLSKTYISGKKMQGVVVHTLGPKKFKNPPNEPGVVFSELAAITATVWYYIGVKVKCLGVGQPKEIEKSLDFI